PFIRGAEAAVLRDRLQALSTVPEKVATTAEVPFSAETIAALEHTPIEADDLKNPWILPEHLILCVMVKTDGAATRALREAGVDPHAIRDSLRGRPGDAADEPGAHSPPRVARQWRGVVKPGLADAYLTHLEQETIPSLRWIAGFVRATILRREVEDGTEFQVTTYWHSLDAIKAFAGDDLTRAVVPPAAQELMVRYDDRATHHDIVYLSGRALI
ncbi:MAG TPA: antibiotic biosynthesis monooxygenase, partial [Vicinamibacterales bacterium]|nr:antibiotic biosynthesis monooxygenase [Vicinamibacterales bacterium]